MVDNTRPCLATPPVALSCTVGVEAMTVMVDIGIHAHETGTLQPLVISVWLQITPSLDDRIGSTFDYCRIQSLAREIASERIDLIETFAWRLASACLADPMVQQADVHIKKPKALSNGTAVTRIVVSRATTAP